MFPYNHKEFVWLLSVCPVNPVIQTTGHQSTSGQWFTSGHWYTAVTEIYIPCMWYTVTSHWQGCTCMYSTYGCILPILQYDGLSGIPYTCIYIKCSCFNHYEWYTCSMSEPSYRMSVIIYITAILKNNWHAIYLMHPKGWLRCIVDIFSIDLLWCIYM